jgi:hypothetical protein
MGPGAKQELNPTCIARFGFFDKIIALRVELHTMQTVRIFFVKHLYNQT